MLIAIRRASLNFSEGHYASALTTMFSAKGWRQIMGSRN
jgi:hypothetical protein